MITDIPPLFGSPPSPLCYLRIRAVPVSPGESLARSGRISERHHLRHRVFVAPSHHAPVVLYREMYLPVTTEGGECTASALLENPRRLDGILHLVRWHGRSCGVLRVELYHCSLVHRRTNAKKNLSWYINSYVWRRTILLIV